MNSNTNKPSPEQVEAFAKHLDNHLMIIAAPGSGKTFTMTKRILTLLNKGIKPQNIMATTFTKKAANELLMRIQAELPKNYILAGMRLGTIHSCALKVIRAHANKCKLKWNFKVVDSAEQASLMVLALKDYLKENELSSLAQSGIKVVNEENITAGSGIIFDFGVTEKEFSYICSVISSAKIESEFKQKLNSEFRDLYKRYKSILNDAKSIDFSDILYLSVKLLHKHSEVLESYHREIRYLLVDEFQDTNPKQFEFLKLMGGKSLLTVCGDDDQAIYSWRGVTSNMFSTFKSVFPASHTLYLTQNYRSSASIQQVSSTLIAFNQHRHAKYLPSVAPAPAPAPAQALPPAQAPAPALANVEVLINESAQLEAERVANLIQHFKSRNLQNRQIAVLYRLSKTVEDLAAELAFRNLPIKSMQKPAKLNADEQAVFSYVKLIHNLDDQEAFIACCNFPKRKFGEQAKRKLLYIANYKNCSLFKALDHTVKSQASPLQCFKDFYSMITELAGLYGQATVEDFLLHLVKKCKVRNCAALQLISKAFASGRQEFENFIGKVEGDDRSDKLTLSTIHAAKGQEWEVVIVLRVNEGVLPSNDEIEEERRLAYVAATRARSHLVFSCVFSAFTSPVLVPSRFLHEFFPASPRPLHQSNN